MSSGGGEDDASPTVAQSANASAEPPADRPPASLGDYELLGELARGGMGVIYKARQRSLGRLVALKKIRGGPLATDADVQRFRAEAEAAAQLDHPNIVPIYDIGEHEGQPFFSMKLIDGRSLAEILSRSPRSGVRELVEVLITVARAVHSAHQHALLHRDLKPDNILIDANGRPHVTDFGLVKRLGGGRGPTPSGLIVGTPNYMAPEQAADRTPLTTAIDIYALGAILYEMLTGQPPFAAATDSATLIEVLHAEPVPPRARNPAVDRDLNTICLKCLDKEPGRRYGSAEALADDLGRWLRGEPILARPTTPWRRALKWARRRPALAALAALLAIVTVAGVGAVIGEWRLAEHNAQEAEHNAQEAEHNAQEATWAAYRLAVALAQAKWAEGDAERARQLLRGWDEGLRGWEWRYLRRQFRAHLLRTLTGHGAPVNGVAFGPDGTRLASAGDEPDCAVRVWDAADGRELLTLRGHTGAVKAVAFSPDGRRIASAGADPKDPSAPKDGTVRVWDAATGEAVQVLRGHELPPVAVAFSPDGRLLASAARDDVEGELILWDAFTGQRLATTRREHPLRGLAFAPDGQRLYAAAGNATVIAFDLPALRPAALLLGPYGVGLAVAISADGQQVALARDDGVVRTWESGSGRDLLAVEAPQHDPLKALAFSPDRGVYLAAGGADHMIHGWYTKTGRRTFTLRGHNGDVTAIAFSRDGRGLASASLDGTVKLWDVSDPYDELTRREGGTALAGVAFAPDGSRLALAGLDGTVRLRDAATGRRLPTLKGHEGEVTGVAFSPDGQRIASASADATVRLWDAGTGAEVAALRGHAGRVEALAFTPDGRRVVSAGADHTVRLWDVADGHQALCLQGHDDEVLCVAVSTDGGLIASGGRGGTVRLWEAATGRALRSLPGHAGAVHALAFSPDGRRLASGGADEKVRLWDVATGAEVACLRRHTGAVYALAFGPGDRLASAGADWSVKLWDAASGEELLTLRGHTDAVRGLAFSRDGHRLASVGDDRMLKVWDATPLEEGAE